MGKKFTFGDIVRPVSSKNLEYYIVTDYTDGNSIVYEIMKIYPVAKASKVEYFTARKLDLIFSAKEKDKYRDFVDMVNEKRNELGLTERPDYISAIVVNSKIKKGVNYDSVMKEDNSDIIRYDKLKSIDECLDAINDLDKLFNTFGDEAYLQLKDVVIKRVKELV